MWVYIEKLSDIPATLMMSTEDAGQNTADMSWRPREQGRGQYKTYPWTTIHGVYEALSTDTYSHDLNSPYTG